jgi:hypothetical protein
MIFCGFWLFYLAYIQRTLHHAPTKPWGASSTQTQPASGSAFVSVSRRVVGGVARKALTRSSSSTNNAKLSRSFSAHMTFVLGLSSALAGASWSLGNGTKYTTSEFRGLLGDLTGALYFPVSWYSSLLQKNGAEWFKAYVTATTTAIQPQGQSTFTKVLHTVSLLLDAMQGPLGPVISLSIWGCVVSGALSRYASFVIQFSFVVFCGTRSFVSIATKRVKGMKSVVSLVQGQTGDLEAQRTRAGFIRRKTLGLIQDLVGVFVIPVASTLSMAVSSSSSRQFVSTGCVVLTVTVTVLVAFTMSTHIKVKHRRRRTNRIRAASRMPTPGAGTANANASSVTMQSEV